MKIIIPARKGSKGFPLKNRLLFKYTAKIIPPDVFVIVTTNDDNILEQAREYKFNCIFRKPSLCTDEANLKDVILDAIDEYEISKDEFILNLSLTYPERTWTDISDFIELFRIVDNKSMICAKEPKTHPYMCVYQDGRQVVSHNLYRRQDYPKVFQISHFISGAFAGEHKNLNNNLYNDDTGFFHIEDKIDIDTKDDYDKFITLIK